MEGRNRYAMPAVSKRCAKPINGAAHRFLLFWKIEFFIKMSFISSFNRFIFFVLNELIHKNIKIVPCECVFQPM